MASKKIQMYEDAEKTIKQYPVTQSGFVLHGETTVNNVLEEMKNPLEVTDLSALKYLQGHKQDGTPVAITPENALKEVNQRIVSAAGQWIVTINKANSNPENPVMTGNEGAWQVYRSQIGRYLLKADGTARKLSKTDSTKYADGTAVNEADGNVMVRIPALYFKVTETTEQTEIMMSASPFIGCQMLDEAWIGAYIGYVSGGKLLSRSGVNPTSDKTISQFWSLAQQNGSDYGLSDYNHRRLMMLIYLSEFLNLNSQAALGKGMNGGVNNWVASVYGATAGATAVLGDVCGKVAFTGSGQTSGADASHVSLFGIEDPYGWYWEMIQGCYFGNSSNAKQTGAECFLYEGNRMPSADELADRPSGAYRQLVRPTSSGYVKTLLMGEYAEVLPKTLGGGSTTWWCDYHYADTTGQLLLWGGNAYDGSGCGLVSSYSYYAFSHSHSVCAARLAFYGEVTIE